jgi:hypothetical protein
MYTEKSVHNRDGRLELFAIDQSHNVLNMWQTEASRGPWSIGSLGYPTAGLVQLGSGTAPGRQLARHKPPPDRTVRVGILCLCALDSCA